MIGFAEASYTFYEDSSAAVIILFDTLPEGLTIHYSVTQAGVTATGTFTKTTIANKICVLTYSTDYDKAYILIF